MTTVEPYRPPHRFLSDAPSNGRRTHSSSNSIVNIPPAVPSPPVLSARNSPPRKPQKPAIFSSTIAMAVEEKSQWLFTEEELLATPSILDGLDPTEERCRRAKGVNFITQVGILLKLPQLTLAVAGVFFHRFYMRRSLIPEKQGFHHYVGPSSHKTHYPPSYFLPPRSYPFQIPLKPQGQGTFAYSYIPPTEHRSNCTLPCYQDGRKLSQDKGNRHRSRESRTKERLSHHRRTIKGILAMA